MAKNGKNTQAAVEMKPKTYPYVRNVFCAELSKVGLTQDQVDKIKAALSGIGFADLLNYVDPLVAEGAQALLGWEAEEPNGPKFGDDYLIKDRYDRKVRCHKNVRNRPVYPSSIEAYVLDLLNDRWEFNGEPILIGDDGVVLDGQHQLIALVFAQQDHDRTRLLGSQNLLWSARWPDGIVKMNKAITYGIENSDKVVNTMNTCRARTIADVLYRSPHFEKLPLHDANGCSRERAARVCAAALTAVWARTAMNTNPLATSGGQVRATHAAQMEWIEGHGSMSGKFIAYVREVLEDDKDGRISRYLTGKLGYVVAMMWLMAVSDTDDASKARYLNLDVRNEKPLKFSKETEKKAREFWREFGRKQSDKEDAQPAGPLSALTRILEEYKEEQDKQTDPNTTVQPKGFFREQDYIICLAWKRFKEGKAIERKHLEIKFGEANATGERPILDTPDVGGIDLGGKKIVQVAELSLEPHSPEHQNGFENGKSEVSQQVTEKLNGTTEAAAEAEENGESRPLMETILADLHRQHPELGPIFTKSRGGIKWYVWELEAQMIEKAVGKTAKPHPSRLLHIGFTDAAAEEAAEKITDADMTVGFAVEDEHGKWVISKTYKPSTKKKGRK